MVVENNIPPVTVNDSVRIAKGIAAAGFPIAGIVGGAMFFFLPMPYPVVVGLAGICIVFIAFVAALTKERDEYHKINRIRALEEAKLMRQAKMHELQMSEEGYKANLRVWEAQRMAELRLPAPASINPVALGPERVIKDYANEIPMPPTDDVEERDADGLVVPRFVREGRRMARADTAGAENGTERSQRIEKLARHIRNFCYDRNPSQANILERIPMMETGLVRSHEDITAALDLLAVPLEGRGYGWVTPRTGRGTPRLWVDPQTGQPMKK